jgi:hypothetical protein
VALKILPADAGRDPAFAERFAREARALAKLTHPGIVTVYDFGESDGRFYVLMEFVDGVDLRHLLQERRLMPDEALQIVPQLCEALQYAHEQGVVHRDIKPENILLDKRGHVKIADFGLAKLLGQQAADSALTGSHQVMGTPHYMAPEQMERPLAVDHRADIYSLGVVFYEMLTGELPLGRFAPPSQKVQVDVRLDEIVLRALEKEPERRYQHASDVKAEVETIRDAAGGAAGSHSSHRNMGLRERRMALTQALNAQDKEAIKSFLDPAFVVKGKGGKTVADYWYFLDQMAAIFYYHPEYHQSLEIESIDEEAGVARIVTRRVEGMTALWLFPVNNVSRWIETWKTVNGSWLCVEERVISFRDWPAIFTRWSWEGPATSGKRKALALLPQDKTAAIKAYREETGTSLAEAKAAVEAMARKHGLPVSSPSLLTSATTWGVVLCIFGISACFLPAVTVHIYNVIEPGQASGNQRWTSLPDPGLFSWEWTTITATFLALGLYLIGTHAVRRLALQRACAIILAGIVVLVVDVYRAQANLRLLGHMYNTPYVGFYVVGVVAVALLILGVITLRNALVHAKAEAGAGLTSALGRKLHSLWESALSLCIGSRVQGPSNAPLSGTAPEGEEPVSHGAAPRAMAPEPDPVGGSQVMPENPTSNPPPSLPHE